MTFTVATVCARGGSKGIPGKNLALVAGMPLIAHSIIQAQACDFIDELVISTDDPRIAEVARQHGADVPVLRPAELAQDTSAKMPVIRQAVEEFEARRGRRVDIVIDLDVTAPLRTIDEIRACWMLVQADETEVVFTVCPATKNPYFNMVELVGGYARLSKEPEGRVVRRQDAPTVYAMNASIYAYRRDYVASADTVIGERSRVVIMPSERSHDVDSSLDLAFLEFLVERGHVRLPFLEGSTK